MNERANVFARVFAEACRREVSQGGTKYSCLHVYTDGYVVYSQISPDEHRLHCKFFPTRHPGFEEARVGDVSVFVLPRDNRRLRTDNIPELLVTLTPDGYHDHRYDDFDCLDAAVELLQHAIDSGVIDSPGPGLKVYSPAE